MTITTAYKYDVGKMCMLFMLSYICDRYDNEHIIVSNLDKNMHASKWVCIQEQLFDCILSGIMPFGMFYFNVLVKKFYTVHYYSQNNN